MSDNAQGWCSIESAPEKRPVRTVIQDSKGERNDQVLTRRGNLWFFPDMSMYVYYQPTHWMPINEAPKGNGDER